MNAVRDAERIETVVVGGGQAGLSVGYHLARRGLSFVILDANERIGDSWRKRWDSLRLFTPARFNGLDGYALSGPAHSFSTKDEVADYLETYAARFGLPVRTGVRVRRLSRNGSSFPCRRRRSACSRPTTSWWRWEATSFLDHPRSPRVSTPTSSNCIPAPTGTSPNFEQGRVLVVGVGNSGAEIALDVAAPTRHGWPGPNPGGFPSAIESALARFVFLPLMFRVIGHRVLTVRTPIGRKMRPKLLSHAAPLVRVKPADIAAAGIERVSRVVGTRDGLPVLEDERVLPGGERHLVHGLPSRLLLDRPSGLRRARTRSRTSQSTCAGSSPMSPGCTSSGCSSSMQCRPDFFPASAEMPNTSSSTSHIASRLGDRRADMQDSLKALGRVTSDR